MRSGQALGGCLASLVPDSRISFPLDYGFRRFFNGVQKVILLLLAVKTQIFAILDNLVHRLRTWQSNVVTLRAAKRMLVCTMFPGNLDSSDRWDSTYGSGRGIDFIILAVTLVFRFEVPLTVAKRTSQFIGYILLQAYLAKLIYYSVESLESRWTIGCYVVQATKWRLLRGFLYLQNSK